MKWYHYLSYFFGGAFFTNAIPHFVMGVTGHPFQSPFATPPGEGLSSAVVNVLWGFFNAAIAYLLLARVGSFELRKTVPVLAAGLGVLLMGIMLAHAFGRFYGASDPVTRVLGGFPFRLEPTKAGAQVSRS